MKTKKISIKALTLFLAIMFAVLLVPGIVKVALSQCNPDTTPPQIICSADIAIGSTTCTGEVVNYTTSAVDDCGLSSLICTPPSGATFPTGITIVTCTAVNLAGFSSSCSFTVTVYCINTQPTFTPGPNQIIPGNAGPQSVPNWATNISPGPASEASQTVTFIVSNDNPSLFLAQPAIDNSGTLTYTPVPNTCGLANVTVVAMDNGGTANGGDDTSDPASFTIQIINCNQCPTANPLSISVDQDSSVNFQLPATDPDGDPVQYIITQPPAHGIVVLQINTGAASYSPSPGYIGPDSFKYKVNDGQCDSAEATVSITVADTTPPDVTIITPQANVAVQDGVTFQAQVTDASGIDKVFFFLREPDGGDGIPIGYEDLAATFNSATGYWEYPFDTTVLQDGYYVILAKAIDSFGNEGWSDVVTFSIRNWAVIEKLPSTPNSKAGRTMPIKFSLRIAASVDPAQPFVYNEDLEIRIYRCNNTSCSSRTLMQTSVYGTKPTNYKIDVTAELYQTNFQTAKTPAQYLVEIWRPTKNFLVGSFTFKTVK